MPLQQRARASELPQQVVAWQVVWSDGVSLPRRAAAGPGQYSVPGPGAEWPGRPAPREAAPAWRDGGSCPTGTTGPTLQGVLPLSVIVITRNEAAHIADALASVAWADEIVVVDADSTDETVAIARRFTDRVVVRDWAGLRRAEELRRGASRATTGSCRSTPTSASRPIWPTRSAHLLLHDPPARGYRIPRVTWHLGRWIRSTDWYPDYQLRLYDRRRHAGPACRCTSR